MVMENCNFTFHVKGGVAATQGIKPRSISSNNGNYFPPNATAPISNRVAFKGI
jgi:hypothetical protein